MTLSEKLPRRCIVGVMIFLACMFSYFIRSNLSIIIVAMVKVASKDGHEGPVCSVSDDSTGKINATEELPNYGMRYEWNQHVQGLLLSGYFYGVLPSSIPGGMLAEKYGGSRIVLLATLLPGLLNLVIPWASSIHYGFVFVLRFLKGFFGGALYPALHTIISKWVPPNEKGMFVWTMQGGPFGALVTFTLCGQVIPWLGWHAAFYFISFLMLLYCALWAYLIYDTPDDHPNITEEEKAYIKDTIGTSVTKKKEKFPIMKAVKSPPFLVLLWAHFANMWGVYFISTNGPKYTLEVLGLDMKSGGALTGLPYITRLGAGAMFAAVGDYLRKKDLLTVTKIRKGFMIFSHLVPALCLIAMTYAGCNAIVAIVMMVLGLTFNGAACQTNMVNHHDLSPNYAGSLFGIMNLFGSCAGFIIPLIVGALTNERNGVEEWRVVFWISVSILISATLFFWCFGSAKIQPWNEANRDDANEASVLEEGEEDVKRAEKSGRT